MQEPSDDGGDPADDEPPRAKQRGGALQWMSNVDIVGLNRPFLLPQATQAGTTSTGQRQQQPNQDPRMHLGWAVRQRALLNPALSPFPHIRRSRRRSPTWWSVAIGLRQALRVASGAYHGS